MSIYCCGDIHSNIDIRKLSGANFKEQKDLTKKDTVIQLGDFGLVWGNRFSEEDKYWLNWLSKKNFTTVFLKGNHENHSRLNSNEFPTIKMFGGEVKKIWDSVFMLQSGHIYTIEGKTFFVMGGAMSIDKDRRVPFVSWWPDEMPSYQEFELGLENLKKVNNEVDYIVSHTIFEDAYKALFPSRGFGIDSWENNPKYKDPTHKMFTSYKEIVRYKKWFGAHFHMDVELPQFKVQILYNKIVKVE